MYQIGVDLGGMTIKAGIVTDEGEILFEQCVDTKPERENIEIMKSIRDLVLDLLKTSNIDKSEIRSVGIGTPGTIDFENGIVVEAYNLGFTNLNMREILTEMLDLPIFVENDANCAAYGEFYIGSAKGNKSICMLTIGTGLGSGLILNGKAVNGSFNCGGEIGHMVLTVGGNPCTCGRNGCFEAYCSATALIKATKEIAEKNHDSLLYKKVNGDIDKLTPIILFDAKREGDKSAIEVIDKFNLYFAEAIANIINAVEPEVIVIGGGVSRQGEYLLEDIRKLTYEKCFSKASKTKIITATLFNDAGIIGASFLKH